MAEFICVRCELPITGAMIGMGDGTGQRFGHRSCYWRTEAERLERERDALLAAGNAMAKRVGPALVHGHVWALLDTRDAWRALAPADGEQSD